jgi:hypothetical protein
VGSTVKPSKGWRRPGPALDVAGEQNRATAGDTSSKSQSELWRPASGGGGWLSGARKGNGVREEADLIDSGVREAVGRVRLGLTCVRRLVYYQI